MVETLHKLMVELGETLFKRNEKMHMKNGFYRGHSIDR